ncbi:MAG: HEAT repeat domain-containing protein [Neisseriaceae bacterium]|nr:HEAT repeat domain-containing protein [Neisseriaceae bacterium]
MANQENEKIDFKINFNEIYQDNKILFWGIIGFIVIVFILYFPIKEPNNFGDYFGGVLNPILAFVSFIAILWTVALQRHSIKLQARELSKTTVALEESKDAQKLQVQLFKQQQFETTFFNMLEFLRGSYNKDGTDQYPLTLLSLLDNLEDFTDSKEKRTKYINIIKTSLAAKPFLNMIKKYPYFNKKFAQEQEWLLAEMYNIAPGEIGEIIEKQIYYPYTELKNMIEKYSLFEFISYNEFRNFIRDDPRFVDYQGNCVDPDYSVYEGVLKYFNLSAFGRNYLLLADRINLEKNPDELSEYAENEFKPVRKQVATNKNTPQKALEKLSEDNDDDVRGAVADNENVSEDILHKLANDKNYRVRWSVALNKKTPKETLILLSQDSEEEVRKVAINNENFKS